MKLRFLHAADLHLDTPFRGLSRQSPELARVMRDASLDAFDSVVDTALRREVSFCLFAGDIYDGVSRGARAQLRFRDGLARLSRAGIPSFVVHGNHDPLEGWSSVDKWPALVHHFGSNRVLTLPVISGGRTVATVSGISFATRHEERNLAAMFPPAGGPGFHVALLHTHLRGVAGGAGHGRYAECDPTDLMATGHDYWALGHIHTRSTVALDNGSLAVYPGNLQGRGFRSSEMGPKGAVIVEFDPDHPVRGVTTADVSFHPCDRVRFESVVVDCPEEEVSLDLLADRLTEGALAPSDGRLHMVRGVVTGRGPVHGLLAPPGRLEELTEALHDRARRTDTRLHWDRLVDLTAPEVDLATLRNGDDIISDLVSLTDERLGSPDPLSGLAGPEPPVALSRRAAGHDTPSDRDLLTTARDLALEALLDGAG